MKTGKRRQPADSIRCKHCGEEFRAITFRHLRNIHGYDDEHPIDEYKRRFRLQFALCPKSRKKISKARENFWERRGQHWTRTKVLSEIRLRRRAGQSMRTTRIPISLREAASRYFGGWRAAVEKAGLDYERATGIRYWDQAQVVAEILGLANRGLPLDAHEV
jgi:hypothetical protein